MGRFALQPLRYQQGDRGEFFAGGSQRSGEERLLTRS